MVQGIFASMNLISCFSPPDGCHTPEQPKSGRVVSGSSDCFGRHNVVDPSHDDHKTEGRLERSNLFPTHASYPTKVAGF